MGLIHSRASKKLARAETKLLEAQTRQVDQQTIGTWAQICAAIEAGEASWADLSPLQKLAMPIHYAVRCKAAERRRGAAGRP